MPAETWTAERVLAASDEWVWIPDDAPSTRTDEFLVVQPPPYRRLATMAWVFGSSRPAERLADDVEAAARDLGSEKLGWRLSDGTVPHDLEAVVTARGGRVTDRMDVLAVPLADRLPDFGTPPGIEVRRVRDAETVADLLAVSADGFGEGDVDPERHPAALAEARRGLDDDSVGYLVAYVDGRPAGAGGWTLVGDVCRLWGGTTHTAFRRRGAYRAVLAERLRLSKARGATLGLTHGVIDTSSPILRGLGFTRYGEQRIVEQPLA
jgi:hypothetical protein